LKLRIGGHCIAFAIQPYIASNWHLVKGAAYFSKGAQKIIGAAF
jgi:hypothetical protein